MPRTLIAVLIIIMLIPLIAHAESPQETARGELEKLGIPCTTEEFMIRAEEGDTGIVGLFLDAGMYYNAKDKKRWTALMWAASEGQTDTVKLLLDKGANVNTEGADGSTALILAEAGGHTDTVELLLEYGARADERRRPVVETDSRGPLYGREITHEAPEGMVYVPAGKFTMGVPRGMERENESPEHRLYMNAFYIDKYEVTNEQFRKFVDSTGYVTDAEKQGWGLLPDEKGVARKVQGVNWRHPRGPETGIDDIMNHPVVWVSWNDAVAYAKWAGKRLPTEAEWEKAARGIDGRKFPWGKSRPDGTRCNFADRNSPGISMYREKKSDDGYTYTAPVGTYERGRSPYGVHDMAGNVWEWCADWYEKEYYEDGPTENPRGPSTGSRRMARGGGYSTTTYGVRTTVRAYGKPDSHSGKRGFRCALDADTGVDLYDPERSTVALWHFDEMSGNTAHDNSGDENHGTVRGAKWVAGKLGGALEFDGMNDYVDIPHDILPQDAFSITLWFLPKAPFGNTKRMDLVASPPATIRNDDRPDFGSNLAFTIYSTTRRYHTINPTVIPSTGRWHHVAAIYDKSVIKLYLNGNLSATQEAYVITEGDRDLSIGAYKWLPHSNPFKGIIDEVAVYDRALTAEEVKAGYAALSYSGPAASDEGMPEKIAKTYWEAIMRMDYEGAWKVVCEPQKKEITADQFAAHWKALMESASSPIKEVAVKRTERREDYTLVHLSLKTTDAKGEDLSTSTSRVIKRDGRWGLELSKSFIKAAKKH